MISAIASALQYAERIERSFQELKQARESREQSRGVMVSSAGEASRRSANWKSRSTRPSNSPPTTRSSYSRPAPSPN